ncbi:MAG: hypothetical protein BGO04_00375 [Microbacterium sp. 70-38]|nr:MAG: hypothetical protein BGO04_00375 [Microbacterium sp. 70-38]
MNFVDLKLRRPHALIEVDGESKYLDETLRSGRSLEDVLLREKQREDWIRGATGLSLARVGAAHIRTPEVLASRLASFGIRPAV